MGVKGDSLTVSPSARSRWNKSRGGFLYFEDICSITAILDIMQHGEKAKYPAAEGVARNVAAIKQKIRERVMKIIAGTIVVGVLLSGCVATNSMLVDPQTGTPYNCSAGGFGIIGVPVALAMQANCEKQMKDLGYVTMADFQKSGGKISGQSVERSVLTVISNPSGASIFAGPNSDSIQTRLGTTPYQLQNPNGRLWAKECYQLKKDGYRDTEVRCYDQISGDRAIDMTLTAISE